jgi:hydroxyethylthiazole kinase
MNHIDNNHLATFHPDDIKQQLIDAWLLLQSKQPLLHYISNTVAANYVANVLLAVGASPALIDNPFEAADFVKISAALNINLGTPTSEQMQAMQSAAETAHQVGIPWVLDPVGYGPILKWRSAMSDTLLQYKPSVIRGNASELSGLAGQNVITKGVDSTLSNVDVLQHVQKLFAHSDVIAISGESDFILSKEWNCIIRVDGGSHLQPKVTATGCALGALIAAYCAVTTPTLAAIAAHVHFAIAGQRAYQKSQSVGSFNVAFLDALFEIKTAHWQDESRFEILTLEH